MAAFVREAMDGKYRQSTKKKDKLLAGAFHGIILVPNVVSLTPPYVEDVVGGSPAAKAGLQADDLIVYIEGDLVSSIKMFRDLIKSYPAGTPLRFEVQRGSRLVSLTVTMVEQPKKKT
jgi:serine protease Do